MEGSPPVWTEAGVVKLFEATVGREKAELVVRQAALSIGIAERSEWSFEEAKDVLERIADTPGLLGIAARFAKSRMALAARGRLNRSR